MFKILIAECIQEISSFNPQPSDYSYFRIQRGEDVLAQRHEESAIGGALKVFDARSDVEVVPVYSAEAESAGILSGKSWKRLASEFLDSVAARIDSVDALYISLHGAMAAEGELDPEGFLLSQSPEAGRTHEADRHLSGSAWYPDGPNAASDRRSQHLPHLPTCRRARYRRARGAAASCDPG